MSEQGVWFWRALTRRRESSDGLYCVILSISASSLFTSAGKKRTLGCVNFMMNIGGAHVFVKTKIFEYFLPIVCNQVADWWAFGLACISVLIQMNLKKDISISFPHNSLSPFECDGVTKGCGTNSISSMMLPYLGHDITSPSLSNPLVADTE